MVPLPRPLPPPPRPLPPPKGKQPPFIFDNVRLNGGSLVRLGVPVSPLSPGPKAPPPPPHVRTCGPVRTCEACGGCSFKMPPTGYPVPKKAAFPICAAQVAARGAAGRQGGPCCLLPASTRTTEPGVETPLAAGQRTPETEPVSGVPLAAGQRTPATKTNPLVSGVDVEWTADPIDSGQEMRHTVTEPVSAQRAALPDGLAAPQAVAGGARRDVGTMADWPSARSHQLGIIRCVASPHHDHQTCATDWQGIRHVSVVARDGQDVGTTADWHGVGFTAPSHQLETMGAPSLSWDQTGAWRTVVFGVSSPTTGSYSVCWGVMWAFLDHYGNWVYDATSFHQAFD